MAGHTVPMPSRRSHAFWRALRNFTPAETSAGGNRPTPAHPGASTPGAAVLHRHILRQSLNRQSHGVTSHSRAGVGHPAIVTSRQRRHFTGIAPASTQGGGAARRLRVGLKADPGTAARLEAGNCEEVFACLF